MESNVREVQALYKKSEIKKNYIKNLVANFDLIKLQLQRLFTDILREKTKYFEKDKDGLLFFDWKNEKSKKKKKK